VKALALAIACFALASGARSDIRVDDDAGRTIVLASPARRIVSLAPHATELLFAAGAGARVVGAVRGSNHPREARDVPLVGDVHALDIERIVSMRPDLVVTWPYTTPAQIEKLRARAIPVFTSNPGTPDAIATVIERLGTLADTEPTARQSANAFRDKLRAATARRNDGRRIRVFYQIWHEPLYTIGGAHLISQAIGACGGDNVFASLSLPAPQVTIEAVLAARPDAIIAGADGALRPPWLDTWRRWRDLAAVRNEALFVVDADLLHRPGPRFAEGVATLCAAIAQARRKAR
jgi:iron complex transport system substrate-binding protein